jgi:hypothetical protein
MVAISLQTANATDVALTKTQITVDDDKICYAQQIASRERPMVASSHLCGRVWTRKHYQLCESRPLLRDLLLAPE